MSKTVNCLVDFPDGNENHGCPSLPSDITSCPAPGAAKARDLPAVRSDVVVERQAGSACSIPGSGNGGGGGEGGKTITFTSGPTPGPTCAGSCGGHLCSGYWCSPTPTGAPPGFQDPKDPSSTGFTASQTSVSQGFSTGGSSVTTGAGTTGAGTTGPPYSGSGCSSYTATSTCSAGGCASQTLCVPTKPCPSSYVASGTPVCSPNFPYCLATTVLTRCAKKTPVSDAGQKRAVITIPASLPTPSPITMAESLAGDTHNQAPQLDITHEPPLEKLNETGVSIDSLFARQATGCGGSANGGCDYLLFCKTCVAITKVPCLQADIHAITGAVSGTDVSAQVMEDGIVVCKASINCALWDTNCSGISNFDCGGGSKMSWRWNYIQYTSAKYSAVFPMYLPRTVTDKIVFCCKFIPYLLAVFIFVLR